MDAAAPPGRVKRSFIAGKIAANDSPGGPYILWNARSHLGLLVDHLTPLDRGPHQVHSEMMGQFTVIGDVQNQQVGQLSRFQRSHTIRASQGVRSVDGGSANGLRR